MRIVRITDWASRERYGVPASGQCPYVGIAIGPGSDDGYVQVENTILQSGRVLPISSGGYTITKLLGSAAAPLASVKVLELMCFEHLHELVVPVARANGIYAEKLIAVAGAAGVFSPIITIPFIARPKARVYLKASAAPAVGSHSYKAIVRTYSARRGLVDEQTLVTANFGAALADSSFYIGGTNEGESWHEVRIEGANGDGVAVTMSAEVETVGEAR